MSTEMKRPLPVDPAEGEDPQGRSGGGDDDGGAAQEPAKRAKTDEVGQHEVGQHEAGQHEAAVRPDAHEAAAARDAALSKDAVPAGQAQETSAAGPSKDAAAAAPTGAGPTLASLNSSTLGLFGPPAGSTPASAPAAPSGGRQFGTYSTNLFASLATSASPTGLAFGSGSGTSTFGGSAASAGALSFGFGSGNGFGATLGTTPTFSSLAKTTDATENVFEKAAEPSADKPVESDAKDTKPAVFGSEAVVAAPAVELLTGEEEENTLMQVRCKLFQLDGEPAKEWKERGVGIVKLNVALGVVDPGRLLMRAEGSLRLLLNLRLFNGMSCEVIHDRFVRVVGLDADKASVSYLLRTRMADDAKALKDAVERRVTLAKAVKVDPSVVALKSPERFEPSAPLDVSRGGEGKDSNAPSGNGGGGDDDDEEDDDDDEDAGGH